MDQRKALKVKSAVKGHFDLSPEHYQFFEDRHGFFRLLNGALLRGMVLPACPDILDIGCGTGASSRQMLEALPACRVWGLDNSPAMLAAARERACDPKRLTLVEGDAAGLSDHFHFSFDAVIYSASIFLIPDFRESLKQARDLLKPGGQVGLTFMVGVFGAGDDNLFVLADRKANEGVSLKKPVDIEEFQVFFRGLFHSVSTWEENFRLEEELLRDFFTVPAMSAGLFPGAEYPERVRKVTRLFDHMPKTDLFFRWMLMVGAKK